MGHRLCVSIRRQPCPWDISLDRLLETEIELEEKPKLDHSFVSVIRCELDRRRGIIKQTCGY